MVKCYLLIRHEVKEYSNWRILFDDASTWRQSKGEIKSTVFQDEDCLQVVTILSEWPSVEKAKDFISDSELSERMQHAGVTTQPVIHFLRQN